jgi:hypothetical protein
MFLKLGLENSWTFDRFWTKMWPIWIKVAKFGESYQKTNEQKFLNRVFASPLNIKILEFHSLILY